MGPRFVWSMAEGYPVVLKQFIQFCLILIYPAWVFGVLFAAAMHALSYVTVYPGAPEEASSRGTRLESRQVQEEEVANQAVGPFNRSAGTRVTVSPAVVRPRQTVTAT